MDNFNIADLADIARSLTVTVVLLMWLYSERAARHKLSDFILDDWNDLRHDRAKELPKNMKSD